MSTDELYRAVDGAWAFWSIKLKVGMDPSEDGMPRLEWESIQEQNLENMDNFFQRIEIKQHRNLLHECNKWSILLFQIMNEKDYDNPTKLSEYTDAIINLFQHVLKS